MIGTDIIQIILNLVIVVIVFVILYVFVGITLEKYEEINDEEPCIYDPKVQELKNIVETWMESRIIPWNGHLECLNHKKKETIIHL